MTRRIGPENLVQIAVTLSAEQYEQLVALSERTRVPMAFFIRDGIDLVLARLGTAAAEQGGES